MILFCFIQITLHVGYDGKVAEGPCDVETLRLELFQNLQSLKRIFLRRSKITSAAFQLSQEIKGYRDSPGVWAQLLLNCQCSVVIFLSSCQITSKPNQITQIVESGCHLPTLGSKLVANQHSI